LHGSYPEQNPFGEISQYIIRISNDSGYKENELPDQIRARILYLAEFTDIQTKRILAGDANSLALIEVNTSIMRGLRAAPLRSVGVQS
jgi:flagellar biosynthesis regulator FlaF